MNARQGKASGKARAPAETQERKRFKNATCPSIGSASNKAAQEWKSGPVRPQKNTRKQHARASKRNANGDTMNPKLGAAFSLAFAPFNRCDALRRRPSAGRGRSAPEKRFDSARPFSPTSAPPRNAQRTPLRATRIQPPTSARQTRQAVATMWTDRRFTWLSALLGKGKEFRWQSDHWAISTT